MADTALFADASDQRFYDEKTASNDAQNRVLMTQIETYHAFYANWLRTNLQGKDGIVTELRAGSCNLPYCIGRTPGVTKVYSADTSSAHMHKMLDFSVCILILIPQREACLWGLHARWQLGVLLQSQEVAVHVSENISLRKRHHCYLTVARFSADFIRVSVSKIKNRLKALNGVLFSDGVLYCGKARELGA